MVIDSLTPRNDHYSISHRNINTSPRKRCKKHWSWNFDNFTSILMADGEENRNVGLNIEGWIKGKLWAGCVFNVYMMRNFVQSKQAQFSLSTRNICLPFEKERRATRELSRAFFQFFGIVPSCSVTIKLHFDCKRTKYQLKHFKSQPCGRHIFSVICLDH